VSFCKKEVQILQTEEQTIVDVAKSQCMDVMRYLDKESAVLKDVIHKQHQRQKAEFSRLLMQCGDCNTISKELDQARCECVIKLLRV